jgi:hypothetical protein
MDGTERRLSGLCTEEGRKCPEGARMTEPVWHAERGYGLGSKPRRKSGSVWRAGGGNGAQAVTDRPTLAELVGDVRRGSERVQQQLVRLEKRLEAVDAEMVAGTARIIQAIATPWRTNVYFITLERISTGERAPSMVTRQASEDAARAYAQDAIRQSPDAGDLWIVEVETRS